MPTNSIANTEWIASENLLVSNLQADHNKKSIVLWEQELNRILNDIPDGANFKALFNLHGFNALDMGTHKIMRKVIPLTLSNYNFRVGYLDLFDDVKLPLRALRNINCKMVAHVHHDEAKMTEYQKRFGRLNERFFTDYNKAYNWIIGLDQ